MDDATLRQIEAADPATSTWLTANAGSGKTRVLTDRVARLLFHGTPPQNILCLTFTKAAAAEMQNRLFRLLADWAMKPDDKLREALANLGEDENISSQRLSHARTLFARAIDTPGGLRIQTIHAFCASLIRRFPLESGISPSFSEIDSRQSNDLLAASLDRLAEESQDHQQIFERFAELVSASDINRISAEIARRRAEFEKTVSKADIWKHFGLRPGYDAEALLAETFQPGDADTIRLLTGVLSTGSTNDRKAGDKLAPLANKPLDQAALDACVSVFLTGAGAKTPFSAKIETFPTKAVRQANPALMEALEPLMLRVERARVRRDALTCAEATWRMHRFARALLDIYEDEKRNLGCLDFDDLILNAERLLTNRESAQWVLFRLDGGIDHILVDEAQDTSPAQWNIVQLLAQEFAAGKGARDDIERTLFVVGDFKQSIYSFQGADPSAFERMRKKFASAWGAAQKPFNETSLEYSFRSSPAILSFVDAVFASGKNGVGGPSIHRAHKRHLPGRVDIWPLLPGNEKPPDKEWYDPTDMIARNDHRVILAERLAAEIERMVKEETIPGESGDFRPIDYGDFLILVQKRSGHFHQIIRACKARGLPVAGADRLRINAELAIKDLRALLSFLATPADDLSLAAALRSPLFGLSEDDLFRLAHGRGERTLWSSLVASWPEDGPVLRMLTDLRNKVDFLAPYEILERILTRHEGRTRLLSRLGPEAEEGIDAFLSMALEYEQTEPPSLTGFLEWVAAAEGDVSRQPDNAGGKIRVMTTHGAKGLEENIVILPDTADFRTPRRSQLLFDEQGYPIWNPGASAPNDVVQSAVDAAKAAERDERERLFYVAMTRARTWLIICGSGKESSGSESWHRMAEAGMQRLASQPIETPTGPGARFQHGTWQGADTEAVTQPATPEPSAKLPDWASLSAEAPEPKSPILSPSSLGGEKSLPSEGHGQTPEKARLAGDLLHLLLEKLPDFPASLWGETAENLARHVSAELDRADVAHALAKAADILNNPDLQHVFGKTSLPEVVVAAALPELEGARIRGAIDRLVVGEREVLIVDFKSNREVPEKPENVPEGILRQMGAYVSAIRQIYPDKDVNCAILWTETASLMPLPHDLVTAALGRSCLP